MTQALALPDGRSLPRGFPTSVLERALVLILETASIHQAQRCLEQEMLAEDKNALVPAYDTVLMWARQNQGVIQAIHVDRKRDMVLIADDVALAWGQRALEASGAKDKDGRYEVSHRESAYHYNVAMQRRTEWENAGSKAPQMAVQFNLVTREKP